MASHRSRAAPRAVATATTLLLLTVLLATAHTATALSALEELIVSQYNTTYIGGFGREYTTTNYTIPTNTSIYEVDPETMIQSFSNAVVVDPYLLTQAEVDFFRQQLPYTVLQRESAPYIPVRASQVAGCTAVHSVCCAYYWVTESYPPGLSLDDVDPSLILWNGSATNTSIDFNFTNTFSGVQCNATTTAAIPAIQLRDPKACYVPMLARTVGTDPPQWDFMCPATARAVDRYIQISTAYNSADPTAMALIQKRYGQSLEAGFDPWAYIGASALSGSVSYGDSLVQVIHNKTLGYIPVVAPIVVNVVILVLILFMTLILCANICYRKSKGRAAAAADLESGVTPAARVEADNRRSPSAPLMKRISPDSAMSSDPSELRRVNSNSSMGSQRGRGGAGMVRQGSFQGGMVRQGSFQGPMLPRTMSQGSIGSRNGSFRVNMAGLPPPPIPPPQQTMMMVPQQPMMVSPYPVNTSPVTVFPQQQQQQQMMVPQTAFPPQPGFIPTWQASPPTPQPLQQPGTPVRRLSQANLRTGRPNARVSPAEARAATPTDSILQKQPSFRRNGSMRRVTVTEPPEERYVNPLAQRRSTLP